MFTYDTTLLDWQSIRQKYPDSWVMLGYPESEYRQAQNVRKGSVIFANTEEDVTYTFSEEHIQELREQKAYKAYTIKYTGKIPTLDKPHLGLFIRKLDNAQI
jgi:hypothetical protein